MIYTDRFVYVHQPKTGGTFVTTVLLRLHGVHWSRFTQMKSGLRKELVFKGPYGAFVYDNNKHGTCDEIAKAHRLKPVLATVRNPFDTYVSQYEFGWWRKRKWLRYYRAVPNFQDCFGHFPNLSFEEFLRLTTAAFATLPNRELDDERGLGLESEYFIKYYLRNSRAILPIVDDSYIAAGRYRNDMYDVRFVHTQRLNQELYDFLLGMGYRADDLAFVIDHPRVLPQGKGRSEAQKWQSYYSPELKRLVRQKDRLLFAVFPEFDV